MNTSSGRFRLALMSVLCLLVCGCGQGGGTTSPPPTGSDPGIGTGAGVSAQLTVTVDDGAGTTTTRTLTCNPQAGTVEDPAAACAALADPSFLDPVSPELACTEVYGGSQTATVTGTLNGARVDASFNRVNGCEIARWDAAAALLGEPA